MGNKYVVLFKNNELVSDILDTDKSLIYPSKDVSKKTFSTRIEAEDFIKENNLKYLEYNELD